MMRPDKVVELHGAEEAAVQGAAAGEVVAPEDHTPMFGENRLLQALHEAIGPRVAGLDARLADAQPAQVAANSAWNSLPRSVSTRCTIQPARRAVELTRFRGHPIVGAERKVHDAEEPSAVFAGVPAADRRAGP
jgi:hypothetical protein